MSSKPDISIGSRKPMPARSQAGVVEAIEPPGPPAEQALLAFSALGQATRLSMLRMLVGLEPDGGTVGEIAQAMQCPQNTASGHLAVLSRAQLVSSTRKGRSVVYRVDLDGVRWLIQYLMADCCNGDPSACADLLAGSCSTQSPQPAKDDRCC